MDMKKLLTKKMVALTAGLVSVANMATAGGTVTYTYTGETAGGVVMGIHTADYNGGALVGEFVMTSSTPGFTTPLLTYCTDVGAFLQTTYNYTPTAISSATGVAPAWINGGIQNAARLWYNDHGAATTATQTAGVQLAIWELLYNTTTSGFSSSAFFNAGNNGFYLTSSDAGTTAAANYAALLIDNLGSLSTNISSVEWMAPTDANGKVGGSQGLLATIPPGQPTPSPTPDASSTFGLLSVAAGVLAAARSKIKAS